MIEIGSILKDIREAITGEKIKDPNVIEEIKFKLDELENEIILKQLDINKEESKSSSLFISGWRPSIGWIGSFSLAYVYIIQPIGSWISINLGFKPLPTINSEQIFNILLGILGLAGYRTYEKTKKVHNLH